MDTNKNIASRILQENREWFAVDKKLPKPGQKVVIRICDPSMEVGKTGSGQIIVVEDIKIGMYIDNKWMIAPPYPKFDYSYLSSGPFINDGAIVTHWAIPEDAVDENDIGEIEAWENRFSIAGDYENFSIKIDPKYEKLLYRACSLGAACIRKIYGEDKDTLPMIAILWDIQAIMDQDAEIRDGELIKDCGDVSEAIEHIDKAKKILEEDDEEGVPVRTVTLSDIVRLDLSDRPVRICKLIEKNVGTVIAEGKNLREVLDKNPELVSAIYYSHDDTSRDGYVFIDVKLPEENK